MSQSIPHREGQVVVTIDYRVPLADAPQFADAMRKLVQVRQRNGARRWSLMVDVTDPELWVERFQYPSWVDYLRQRNRGTVADRAVWEHARTFHRGDTPPRVRRLMAQPVEDIAARSVTERARMPAIAITDPALPPDPSPSTGSSTSDSATGTPSGKTR